MATAGRLSEKWTFGREVKIRGQMWNSEDKLSVKYNIPASQKGVYLFYNSPGAHLPIFLKPGLADPLVTKNGYKQVNNT